MTEEVKQEEVPNWVIRESKPSALKPFLEIDIKRYVNLGRYYGLSKPAISENGDRFICGTENQFDEVTGQNKLVLGTMNTDRIEDVTFSTYTINEHVRDLVWFDHSRIIAALNRKLGLITLGENGIDSVILFPEFHTDTIRQIAVNPIDPSLVISGGFDGNVFVTNIAQLFQDIQKNEKKSENSVYMTRAVVGSVAWHVSDANVASATTDVGILHIFDCRTDHSKPAFIYDTRKVGIYSHAYLDDFTIACGAFDGTIQIHDIRYGQEMISFRDPQQQCIGDLKVYNHYAQDQNRMSYESEDVVMPYMKTLCVFGMSSFSMWNTRNNEIEYAGHYTNSNGTIPDYKVCGELVPHSPLVATTDSAGFFSIYDISQGIHDEGGQPQW